MLNIRIKGNTLAHQRLKRALLIIGLTGAFSVVSIAALVYGHKQRVPWIYSWSWPIRTLIKGKPSVSEPGLERVATVFLDLRGRVHTMRYTDFEQGGALTVWGSDLLVLHNSGRIYWLDPDQDAGLQISKITVPDHGGSDYRQLAAEKYPGRPVHADHVRYNDISYLETENGRGLALSYTFVDADKECYYTRVSWYSIPDHVKSVREIVTTKSDWNHIYSSKPCLKFNKVGPLLRGVAAGGRMAFKAPNTIFLGSGDYGRDGINNSDVGIQSNDSDYGKIVQINLASGESRHVSKGHRNPQGVTVTRQGELWSTEHGLRGGDELNHIVDGEDYGWPTVDMGTLYTGFPRDNPGGPGRHTNFKAPVYSWVPSIGVSSVIQIDGFHETWDGDLLVASLKEKALFRMRLHGDRLVSMEPIPIGGRIRDVIQWGPERLALWLDTKQVVVFEIEERKSWLDDIVANLIADGVPQGRAKAAHRALVECNECHSYEYFVHGAGPSLAGVVGRGVAETTFEGYSEALLGDSSAIWDEGRLASYLVAPEEVVQGTSMTGLGLGDLQLAADVVRALGMIKYVDK